jgi:nanoRNase/pAp phosphatase (c-di-AMP/oligoRNAs hydrolase)
MLGTFTVFSTTKEFVSSYVKLPTIRRDVISVKHAEILKLHTLRLKRMVINNVQKKRNWVFSLLGSHNFQPQFNI